MKTISAKRLELACACQGQVDLFRSEWGDKRVPLTHTNWDRAGEIGLARSWLARFLNGGALREYNAACDEAWRVYNAAYDETWRVYVAACDEAWDVYNKARHEALFAALTK